MNNLIEINEGNKVSARELYDFLGLRAKDFSRWCKTNIDDNAFAVENTDFTRLRIDAETPTGGKIQRTDYALTIEFAKKLCMTSKTERGEQARNYFMEKVDAAMCRAHFPGKVVVNSIIIADENGELRNLLEGNK